jgi:peptidoglycan/xylan/chitin deacetylase (PgdA/CDA1 family)
VRALLKSAVLRTFDVTGAYALASLYRRPRLLVACYHGVISQAHSGDPSLYGTAVSAAEFTAQIELLGRWFDFVDLAGAQRWFQEGPRGSKAPVLITFDDGYRNNLTLAAPILRRLGAPAVFFLASGYIGTDRLLWPLEMEARLLQSGQRERIGERRAYLKSVPNEKRLQYLEELRASTTLDPSRIDGELNDFLTWEEVRRLAAMGFELGSHTVEHPILSRLSDEELSRELSDSHACIVRETGIDVSAIAYPNGGAGDFTPAVCAAAATAGYTHAFAVGGHFAARTDNRFAIHRWIISGHQAPEVFRFTVSGLRDLGHFTLS